MSEYYYLASQLPFLQFGAPPNISKEKFLREAKKWVRQKEYELLSVVDINEVIPKADDPRLVREIKVFGYDLRRELSEWRKAQKVHGEYRLPLPLHEIVSQGNPLQIEQKLLFMRWGFLEEKEKEHYFDLEFLVVYLLKLQILERLFTFDKERGRKVFDAVCEAHYG